MYIFFRLYHLLFQRINMVYDVCYQHNSRLDSGSILGNSTRLDDEVTETSQKHFEGFVSMLHGLLDGSLSASRYEEGCRCMLEMKAHQLFSVDKLIVRVMKQLQLIVNDMVSCKLLSLWQLGEEEKDQYFFKEAMNAPKGSEQRPRVLFNYVLTVGSEDRARLVLETSGNVMLNYVLKLPCPRVRDWIY